MSKITKIQLPPEVRKGDPIKADHFNLLRGAMVMLLRMVIARTPQSGADIGIREGTGGFVPFLKRTSSGGGGGAPPSCPAWVPTFREEDGTHHVKFRLGLLNQMAADNWNDEQEIGAEVTKWVTLHVTASEGKITGYELSLDDTPPTQDQMAENFPPDSFKIVLGVIDHLKATMATNEHLEASAIEVFRQSRTPPAPGAEPFKRWWRWKVNANTAGEYPYIT